ncbi:SpoIIE family protein phosphatase [Butyrivibrio sp. FCS014]|uniref:SpoIIE family protein phosphatase n=1 Tax=Butyrivibrio sp. FCS014 TaxID=1408304 RepID=UPI000466E2E3|nr:SpoIIE family protein phosphatase [Butyrivibrio sp. FCS014]
MLLMIAQMSAITAAHIFLTLLLWKYFKDRKISRLAKVIIGLIYGGCSILSTHYGVQYEHMILNVRDLAPLSAGLFFDPASGIIAGLIGGIERYIAGTYFGIGSYTRVACSLSTCLSGFVAALLNLYIFKGKKPSAIYAFFMGAVMEVFHMYVVFITHRADMSMAFYVVRVCSVPMIIFCGLGLALSSIAIRICAGEWRNPFRKMTDEEIKVSQKFSFWLFVVTVAVLMMTFLFSFGVQTQSAVQSARIDLVTSCHDIRDTYNSLRAEQDDIGALNFHIGDGGSFNVIQESGAIVAGTHQGEMLGKEQVEFLKSQIGTDYFVANLISEEQSMCYVEKLDDMELLLVQLPMSEVYEARDAGAYETVFADIMMFTAIYVLISMLVQGIVVNNLEMVNDSLNKITNGNLDETVSVYSSSEFASLSDDINQTVDVLKGYIDAAEKRIAQELEFARTIQDSALPKNFKFARDDFEIFATMDPAKEVGGDFYDFFFVSPDKLAMVIADVSGKGIPASLFMMQAKTAIRTLAEGGGQPGEVLYKANNELCEGNGADMFVTVWLGIINLVTGAMKCANAGHEYPVIRRANGQYELFKDKHSPAVATMEDMKFKEYDLQLNKGDSLFVYTDGIPEAINTAVEQYGVDRMLASLNVHADDDLQTMLPAVRQDLRDFVGEADQFDDVTMLGFKYK